MNVCKLLQVAGNVQRQLVRDYAFKSDLKIKWVRPEKIPSFKPEKSGDLSKLPPVNPKEYVLGYNQSKELQTADAAVQSLFQLGNNSNVHTSNYLREKLIKEVQRHPLDYGSMETRIARMTVTIRRLQEYMEGHPKNVRIKVMLQEMIDKRKKFLKYMRRWDYRRFEWLLEKLDLVYKPPPEYFHWITRKESLQKLTDKHCENVKQERLEAYRKELEAQMIPFLEEAVVKLKFIRQEQIDCDVPVTVTEEQISELKSELETLKKAKAEAEELKKNEKIY